MQKRKQTKKDNTISIVDEKGNVSKSYSSVHEMMEEWEAERNARPLWKKITDKIYYRYILKVWDIINPRLNKNRLRHLWQIITTDGHFSDVELWDLDNQISKFILPRLRRFKNKVSGYPVSIVEKCDTDRKEWKESGCVPEGRDTYYEQKWKGIIDEMIKTFELHVNGDVYKGANVRKDYLDREKKFQKGLALFAKYYEHLWY